ncbi:DUF4440 domain-containing protein [Rubrolithibacter danxiaensis]|uniref:DUF4440 domain-containing protein n=1 Tax=Rubrolithibacter danxiaensis TaxID=3390805 RepID=UPI003BF89B1B
MLLSISQSVLAQKNQNKTGELVSLENYFAALVKSKGIKTGFLKVSDANTVVFKPGPTNAQEFFKDKLPGNSEVLVWEPVWAKISKSGDWGFTTGPYNYKENDSSKITSYGQYLSVWKKNKKGLWKLALDIGIPHKKPVSKPKLVFIDPENGRYIHQQSTSRLQQREDIVLSSDKLFSTILKANNRVAREEFLAEDTRLLFPGFEPVIGKKAVTDFWNKQNLKLLSTPTQADRAYSGELAYTYGEAQTEQKGKVRKYHYIRVWEVQPGFKWSVILEAFAAERTN